MALLMDQYSFLCIIILDMVPQILIYKSLELSLSSELTFFFDVLN